MIKVTASLAFFAILFCSCQSGAEVKRYPWKEFNFVEAGFKADFPCEPKTNVQIFQETPKPVKGYEASCEYKGFKFAIDLSEWFDEFDRSKIEAHFDSYEKEFRRSLGKNENVLKISDTTLADGTPAKFINARSGQLMYSEFHFENEEGIYSVVIKTSGDPDIPALNGPVFDAAAKKFFDSFGTLKK